MDELIYGVWEGRPYDNRRRPEGESPEGLDLEGFMSFNSGNPVTGFVGPQGFLIFDNRVTLAHTLWRYYERTMKLSCGRCTPCRMGSVVIAEALEKAAKGEGRAVDWALVMDVARQMRETSLCGIGLTTPEALIGALTHFPELLRDAPAQPPVKHDFYAVATAPCIEACPAHVNIPRYIDYIRDGHPELATGVLLEHYPLVGSCGRVCVRPCEKACVRNKVDAPVSIKDLKRYAADHAGAPIEQLFIESEKPAATPVSAHVAVVGAGPAGINCAYHLLKRGHFVDIFEAKPHAGGMARLGIPAYRLPNDLLASETEAIERMGGRYFFEKALGRDFTIDSLLKRGYRAVFLGVGCALGQHLGLPDEDVTAKGYLKGLDFLLDIEAKQTEGVELELDGDVVVVGCGNVAMDCCRSARRLLKNGRVTVSYRRTRASAPADPAEITAAQEEDIEFAFLTAPKRVLVEDGRVVGIELVRMEETEPDASGRRGVRAVEGSEFVIPCRYVIAAIGQKMDGSIFCEKDGIRLTRRGTIEVKDDLSTSRPGVFAGGDAAAGPTSLIWGMADGQTAAQSIHEWLLTEDTGFIPRRRMTAMIHDAKLLDNCPAPRAGAVLPTPRHHVAHLPADERIHHWEEVEFGMTDAEARREASRCMRCYRLFAAATLLPIPGKSELEAL